MTTSDASPQQAPLKLAGRHHHPLATHESLSLSVLIPVYNERHVAETSIRRVLALDHPIIRELQVIVVDDCSSDGTSEVLERLASEDDRVLLIQHEKNQGKGAALRTAIDHADGDVSVCHDADLEYNPQDITTLLEPFLSEGADAVFGSRYLSARYRRALMYRHTQMNKFITFLGNCLTDLDLTDLETCYKAVRTRLLKSIPLRENDFRIEVELSFKLAKRRARIFEAPIRYLPRTYQEGKKINAVDGVLALLAMAKYFLIDDLYKKDEYGSHMLLAMDKTPRFTRWLADLLRPYIGDRVLEVGAGIATLTNQFIPRDRYVAAEANPNHLDYLDAYALGKPYLDVRRVDVMAQDDFDGLASSFDTALVCDVLEYASDDVTVLKNVYGTLEPGGRCVVVVPQHPWLYGSLDEALEHRQRYTEARLRQSFEAAGFQVEHVRDFNRFSVPGWWFNGKVLRRRHLSRIQLKIMDTLMPVLRVVDRLCPWSGQSVIGVGVKPMDSAGLESR